MSAKTTSVQVDKAKQLRKERRRTGSRERRELAAACATALLAGDGFLRLPEVLAVFPVSPSTWWQGVKDGRYPASVKLGARCTCWRAEDIRRLIKTTTEGAAK